MDIKRIFKGDIKDVIENIKIEFFGGKSSEPSPSREVRGKKTARRRSAKPVTRKAVSRDKAHKENITGGHIESQADLPVHCVVLTDSDGELSIDGSLQDDYVLIEVDAKKGEALLIASRNNSRSSFALGLKEKARLKGYRVRVCTAELQVIAHLYDENRRQRDMAEESVTEHQRNFDRLLSSANKLGASDIHMEVRKTQAITRFRINGTLATRAECSMTVRKAKEFAQVIYSVVAEEKDVTFNPGQPQDAVIDREVDGVRIRVRLATIPAYPDGFDMVMRLLAMEAESYSASGKIDLSKLGYSRRQQDMINIATSAPVGVIIVAGTTGSGKSTTLKNLLSKKINRYQNNIKVITVEDPPEYFIPGATQVPVVRSKSAGQADGKAVNPFAASIRAAMRSDPDIIMIGEVRDEPSAELLVHAVQSGHQAYTTVHAPSALGIMARLAGIEVGRDVLGSSDFIAGLIYQTLVPTLCPHCSIPIQEKEFNDAEDKSLLSRLSSIVDIEKSKIRFKGKGCDKCDCGVNGRTVAAEVVIPDHEMLRDIRDARDTDAWHHWRKNGGETALNHGTSKMLKGLVDPYVVEQKLGMLTKEAILDDGIFNINEEMKLVTGEDALGKEYEISEEERESLG